MLFFAVLPPSILELRSKYCSKPHLKQQNNALYVKFVYI